MHMAIMPDLPLAAILPWHGDISDGSFSQAILEVGIDPTVDESLLLLGAMVDERIVDEVAIVDVVGDK